MPLRPEKVARAISSHRFGEAAPAIAEAVTWTVVGAETLVGVTAVVDACEQSAAYLADVETRFRLFRVVVAIPEETPDTGTVVIDTLADYTDATARTTTVRSCDIYDFEQGMLTAIVSYNVELDA